MASTIQKTFKPLTNKDVSYLNRDFSQFKKNLIDYTKSYFPKNYQDFSDSSPGTIFIEMASYVGDVLSFYLDQQFKESIFPYTEEKKNVLALSKFLGYKPKVSRPSLTNFDVYQVVPSVKDSTGSYVPDNKYCLRIKEGMQLVNSAGVYFVTTDLIDFSLDSSESPREVSVSSRDDYGIPQFFLLKKTVNGISGKIVQKIFTVNENQSFYKLYLDENNVLDILDVRDQDNIKWYEVDYLAQDVVITSYENSSLNDDRYIQYQSSVPNILKLLRTQRKFTSNINSDDLTYLEFGPGNEGVNDEIIVPSAEILGVSLSNLRTLNVSLDPTNIINSDAFGIYPKKGTQFTVRYLVGGGVESNSQTGDIKSIVGVEFENDLTLLTTPEQNLFQVVKNSLAVENNIPAVGGDGPESIDEIKQNATAFFAAQNRVVTADDYIARIYALPAKFGSIAKATVTSDNNLNANSIVNGSLTQESEVLSNRNISGNLKNPFSINVFLLSYDENKNLVKPNPALFHNIRQYLNQYRMMTDGINLIDGYVVNIGVEFKIVTYNNFNKKEVLVNCVNAVKSFFNIDIWGFSQPINLSQLELEIAKVEGVQSVASLKLTNLTSKDGSYSPIEYNIDAATVNKIVYPSLDPCVFELKNPETDIKATAV
jgi:hypothetical protein